MTNPDSLFQSFWQDYSSITPQAKAIEKLLTEKGHKVINDHVALRTYDYGPIAIRSMEKIFLNYGYVVKGEYDFVEKKLKAYHYEHSNPDYPKVFISELLLQQISGPAQKIIKDCLKSVDSNFHIEQKHLLGYRPWAIKHADYLSLYQESEYAAWVYAFGLRVNHFTVLINKLSHGMKIGELNALLKNSGFKLNSSGGEIKGSSSVFLEQSSTMAAEVDWAFSDGNFKIPSCYYEFAQRHPMPSGELYQGFVEKSADKIFESTNKH